MNLLAIVMFMVLPWLVGAVVGFAVMDVLADVVRAILIRLQRVLSVSTTEPQAVRQPNR